MRNILKAATLESKFPVLSVERGCILSKDADVTVGFKVRLPELFTLTSAKYAAMHGAWVKAIKVLPCYTVVHRQDWFLEEKYRAVTGRDDMGFLDRSFELHFNERPFLNHYAYLFITRTTRKRSLQQSNFSILWGHHSPGGQGQGGGGPVHGERGPVRTHHGRFRAGGA